MFPTGTRKPILECVKTPFEVPKFLKFPRNKLTALCVNRSYDFSGVQRPDLAILRLQFKLAHKRKIK